MLLRTTTGNENFPNVGTSKLQLFFVPSLDHPGKEMPLSLVTKGGIPGLEVRQHGGSQMIPAADGMRPDLFGKWMQGVTDVPDGVCLKLFGQRQLAGQSAAPASLFFRVRSTAAFRRITFPTLAWSRGKFAAVTVEGRFDILDTVARKRHGVMIPPQYERFAEQSVVSRVFRVTEVEAETAPQVVVENRKVVNSEGDTILVPVRRSSRALEL